MNQETLKGGISYNKYVWVANENACRKCQELDGKTFNSTDEIPDIPHPNCKCYIDIIEEKEKREEDKPCDCWETAEKILNDTQEQYGEATSILEECKEYANDIAIKVQEIKNKISENIKIAEKIKDLKYAFVDRYSFDISNDKELQSIAAKIFENIESANNVYKIFEENKILMEEKSEHIDKYYHAKANCESAELGAMEAIWAVILSLFKEIKDYYVKVYIYHKDASLIFKDCLNDLEADRQGLMKALEEGQCSDKVNSVEYYFKNKK